MIKDRFYPATWKKYGEAWQSATNYWKAMAENSTKATLGVFAVAYILLKLDISIITILISLGVLYFVGKWASIVAWNWYMYDHVERHTAVIFKPKWKKMGGTEEAWTENKAFD